MNVQFGVQISSSLAALFGHHTYVRRPYANDETLLSQKLTYRSPIVHEIGSLNYTVDLDILAAIDRAVLKSHPIVDEGFLL